MPIDVDVLGLYQAGLRTLAVVFDLRVVAAFDTVFELGAGALAGVADHMGTVDTLLLHRREQITSDRICAEAADSADIEPELGEADREIGFGAGGAFDETFGKLYEPKNSSYPGAASVGGGVGRPM